MEMKQGIVGRMAEGPFRYQGWPTVCRDENGVLYVAASGYRVAHVCPYGKNVLYISRDDGETWTPPTVINDTAVDDRDGGILPLGDGKLMLTYFHNPMSLTDDLFNSESFQKNHGGKWDYPFYEAMLKYWKTLPPEAELTGSFCRLSRDSGVTWEPAVQAPVSSPHGPVKLRDGRLLWLGKEFHSGLDEYDDKGAIYAVESTDDGKTWQKLGHVDFPAGCTRANIHEPYAIELPDGRIMGALRGQGAEVPFRFCIYTTFSEDGGRTWSAPEALDMAGSPPHMLLHSSGALILSYARRSEPFSERARISYDGGKTFGEEIILSEVAPGDLGYPSTVELSDGSLLTVYYQKLPGDDFCSVLSTRWTLPER